MLASSLLGMTVTRHDRVLYKLPVMDSVFSRSYAECRTWTTSKDVHIIAKRHDDLHNDKNRYK